MKGKGTAGLGILAAIALIIWAVLNPRPQPESPANFSRTAEATTLALGSSYGAALGAQLTLSQVSESALDEEALKAILTEYLDESGLAASQDQINAVVGEYRQIASQARAVLSRVPEGSLEGLIQSGAAPDPTAVLTRFLSQLAASPQGQVAPQKAPSGSLGDPGPSATGQPPGSGRAGTNQQGSAGSNFDSGFDIDDSRIRSDMGGMEESMSQMRSDF